MIIMTRSIARNFFYLVSICMLFTLASTTTQQQQHGKGECPSQSFCFDARRGPCTEESVGRCGPCLLQYLDISGVCVTESEVKTVIKRIEYILDDPTTAAVATSAATSDSSLSSSDYKEEEEGDANKSGGGKSTPLSADKRVADSGPSRELEVTANGGANSVHVKSNPSHEGAFNKVLFIGVVTGVSALCLICLIIAGVCWYRLYRMRKLMKPTEYVGGGYNQGGGYGGDKDSMTRSDSSSGDRKLAHSAQMYHYQHHKQQMLALEKSLSDKLDESENEEGEENEEGRYTVLECPGLAPVGEMEVSNPLFQVKNTSPALSPTSPESSLPSPPSHDEEELPQRDTAGKPGTKDNGENRSPQE